MMKAYSEEKLLWDNIRLANNPFSRLKGLMGKKELREGEGLLLTPCNQVHTYHMRFALDILFLSAKQEVLHVVTLSPGVVGPKVAGAASVLEVAAGSARDVVVGSRIVFAGAET